MRQIMRASTLALLVFLTACLPQLSTSALTVQVVDAKHATITFTDTGPVTDLVLYLGRVTGVLETNQPLTCQPVESLGTSCTAASVTGPLVLTVLAIDPGNVTASAWWTTPSGDKAARATP